MRTLIEVDNLAEATHIESLSSYEKSGLTQGKVYDLRHDGREHYVMDDHGNRNYAALFVGHIKYKLK